MMTASRPMMALIRSLFQSLRCGVAIFVLVFAASARADNNDACASLAAKVQAATRAVQKSASDRAITFEMHLPNATTKGHELQIVCPAFAKSPSGYSIVATWNDGAAPADGFFQQVGSAGAALTGEAAAKVQKGARTCQAEAAGAQTSTAEIEAGKAFLNCQSFARLGGATTITIYHSIPSNVGR